VGWLDDYKGTTDSSGYDPTNAMGSMTWAQLQAMRNQAGQDMAAQIAIAPYEHQAYARDEAGSPLKSAMVGFLLEPGYQAFKAMGGKLDEGDGIPQTPASVAELIGGVKGGWQGLTGDLTPGLLKSLGKAR
jgi:hypothetical protein